MSGPTADVVGWAAQQLKDEWLRTRARYNTDDEQTVLAEQEAYDQLVDYVEANDLNDSEWDPRNA